MTIEIKEVKTLSDRKSFVNVQFEIYKNNRFWVPPLKKAEVHSIDHSFNPAFEFTEAKFWLAFKNGKCMGRIGAIINPSYNEKTGEKKGRFTRLEFFDDREVFEALITTAENWVREKGMKAIHGPLGFSNLDLQGLLVEGFEHLPSIGSVYHQPYYYQYLEDFGYEKENDWIEFRLFPPTEIPEKVLKINEVVKQRYGFHILHFKSSKELKPYGEMVFKVLNEAFSELPYVIPLNDKMIRYYTEKYFNLLNPKLVKIILNKDNEVVGFILGFPSLSEAMQKAKGRLYPFGFLHIMRQMKHPKVVDLMLTGIKNEQQGQGVAALLMTELQKEINKLGVEAVETTGIFETNIKAIQNWKNYDHIQHKRKRCYVKTL